MLKASRVLLALFVAARIIEGNKNDMSETQELEGLRGEVAQTTSAVDAAVLLINGLVNRLNEALTQEDVSSAIRSLRDELDTANNKLATAVAENTPAAEDSDEVYDPTPIGEPAPEQPTVAPGEPTPGEPAIPDELDIPTEVDESQDTGTGADTEVAVAGEQVTGDTSNLPHGSVFTRSGPGVTGSDSAEDTTATTEDLQYDPSTAPADNAADSPSADGNGHPTA